MLITVTAKTPTGEITVLVNPQDPVGMMRSLERLIGLCRGELPCREPESEPVRPKGSKWGKLEKARRRVI
jgi:hypothetical protein